MSGSTWDWRRGYAYLSDLGGGYLPARLLQAAVRVGLLEAVGEGGTAREVAQRAGTEPRATEVVLNALVALEILEKHQDRYTLTHLARTFLLPGAPRDYRGMLAFEARLWGLWEGLETCLRRGGPYRDTGMFQEDPEACRSFMEAMEAIVRARGDAVYLAQTLDFRAGRRFLDVGCGPGTYAIVFCQHHPHLEAILFDLPESLRWTRSRVEAAGLGHRIHLVEGDFYRDPLPEAVDWVFLSNVIHGHDEAGCRLLFRKAYQALRPGGRILIKDHILDATGTRPPSGALFSVAMLLTTPGRDYTFPEVRTWLEEAGFQDIQEQPLPPPIPHSLVTARRPEG